MNKTPAQAFTPPAKNKHGRTGLEIFGGAGHESARIAPPKVREPLGVRRHALREILKNRVFNAISSVLEWVLCIEQLMNEKKVLGILMKQNLTGKLPDS